MAWREQAACRGKDPDIFFRESYDRRTYEQARSICAGCPVRSECLEFALTHHDGYGVWGGMSPRQREAYARQRRIA